MDVWKRRLQRAVELSSLWPHAREVLDFYRALTELQKDILLRLAEPDTRDIGLFVQLFPSLLDLVEKKGPPDLARRANEWRARSAEEWRRALDSYR